MAWSWSESWDPYAAVGDALLGYWDSGLGTAAANTLVAGRFSGSQAYSLQSGPITGETKSSGVNDAVHHISIAIRQTATLTGTTLGAYFQLIDNVTNQCAIVFRSDGAMLLTSGGPAGTVLATYTGAVSAASTWTQFEIEVVIHNTAGSIAVRKNGNASNDFSLGSLNTRPGTNAYANKLTIGMQATVNSQQIDDLIWRSDASSVLWIGDVRIVARMPASDASVQFSKITISQSVATSTTSAIAAGTARYTAPITASVDGSIGSVVVNLSAGYTGNMKCSIFASSGGGPLAVLGSATSIVNPVTGNNTFTFGTPVALIKGAQYIVGCDSDTASGTWNVGIVNSGTQSTTTYAAFPVASPTTTLANQLAGVTVNLTPTGNYTMVSEAQQDAATSYVYDSTPGHADFYGLAALSVTPQTVFGVTTRAFVQKSDAGTRSGAVQLKSGATTVQSPPAALSSSWGWTWRTDVTDPAGGNWTPTSVNNCSIGPAVTA